MGDMRKSYLILVGYPQGKGQLGRSRHRLEDNIKMNRKEIECEGVDKIHLAQDRNQWQPLMNMVMSFQVP
jgi:hypothetical protein